MTNELSVLIETAVHAAEKVRKQAIGDPVWIPAKHAYEYFDQSPKTAAVLKLIRMAGGVVASNALCTNGLFVDMGAIIRCVNDCEAEIYFLLENYPAASPNVAKFTKAFFEQTIDNYLGGETEPVPSKKIRAAVARVLRGRHDHEALQAMVTIHKTYSGYVHAAYAVIMETYGGPAYAHSFNLMGIPSVAERQKRVEIVELGARSVMYSAAFVAHTLGLEALRKEIYDAKCLLIPRGA